MTTKDIKTVELIVNSDQAKAKLDELNTKLDTMKKKREDALNRGDSKALSVYTREVSKLEKEIQRTETRAQGMALEFVGCGFIKVGEGFSTLRELTRELNSGKIERGILFMVPVSSLLSKYAFKVQDIQRKECVHECCLSLSTHSNLSATVQ